MSPRGLAMIALVVALAVAALTSVESPVEGRVVRVPDGDSLEVDVADERLRVRVAGIDAPELGQPWSRRARQALTARVADRTVRLRSVDIDAYERTVAEVYADDVCVGCELVREGHAWAYRHYDPDPLLLDLEAEARAAGRGLWGLPESDRTPPWEWRRAHPR